MSEAAMRLLRSQLTVVVLLGCVAAGVVCFILCDRVPQPAGAGDESAAAPAALSGMVGKRLGDAGAPVQVEAFLPITAGCQDDIGQYLAAAAGAAATTLSVQVFDMRSEAGRERMQTYGVKCASVVVNGRTRFELDEPVGRVLLEGPMVVEDLRAVLMSEVARATGKPAPELPAVADLPAAAQVDANRLPEKELAKP